RRAVAAEADDALVVEPDQVGIERPRVPGVLLPAQRRLVERCAAAPLVAQGRAVDPVLEIGGGLERRGVAEVSRLVLLAIRAAPVDQLVRRRLPAQLGESQV